MSDLTARDLRDALQRAVEPLPYIRAMWEAGSAAFGRDDQYSDLDVHLLVDDGRAEDTVAVVDAALAATGTIGLRYRVPEPTWHGHPQVFYQVSEAGEFALVDFVAMEVSSEEWFLEREWHGEPIVLFDKHDEVAATAMDRGAQSEKAAERLNQLRVLFPMFQGFVRKEILRGNGPAAVMAYERMTLRFLGEILGLRYCPERYDFGPKYAVFDVPPDVSTRLDRLWFVSDLDDLAPKHREAEAWFSEIVAELDADGISL